MGKNKLGRRATDLASVESTILNDRLWIWGPHNLGVFSLGGTYKLGVYNLDVYNLGNLQFRAKHFGSGGSLQAGNPQSRATDFRSGDHSSASLQSGNQKTDTISSGRFWILGPESWASLQTGSLQSRAADLGSGDRLTWDSTVRSSTD